MIIPMNWVIVCDLITLFTGIVMGASIVASRRRSGRRYDY